MKSIDLTNEKVITLADLSAAAQEDTTELRIGPTAVVTPSALEFTDRRRIAIRRGAEGNAAPAAGAPAATAGAIHELFHSPEAEAIKEEICAVGRKLWQRQYVDGNGGNISYRIGPNAVICTPTLMSKADLRPQDLGMVDLEAKQIAGTLPRTSEILMHLEIYKEVPEAKGIVHCHPAHATAYAITGRVPPTCVIPEYEIFIGKVALSPYETPGTPQFARTVIPFVKNHNAVLLSNHGIVCWADTVTHAEWYAEVLDADAGGAIGRAGRPVRARQGRRPAGHQEAARYARPAERVQGMRTLRHAGRPRLHRPAAAAVWDFPRAR
jgi:L-fuculose-phosphate aldolase